MQLFLPRISSSQLSLIEDELHAVIKSGVGAWKLYAPKYEVPERVAEGIRMLAEGQQLKRSVHDFMPSPSTTHHLHTMAKLFVRPTSSRQIIRMERVLRRLIKKGLQAKTLVLERTGEYTEICGFELHQLALTSTQYAP